jgi:HAMP domain-containing protein
MTPSRAATFDLIRQATSKLGGMINIIISIAQAFVALFWMARNLRNIVSCNRAVIATLP